MNLKEFAALKAGDKIENHMASSHGVVSHVHDNGVSVRWGARVDDDVTSHQIPEGGVNYRYTVNSTAWMHWSKAEPAVSPELDRAIDEFIADKPPNIVGKA